MPKTHTNQITLRLPKALDATLRKLARSEKVSMATIARRALAAGVLVVGKVRP